MLYKNEESRVCILSNDFTGVLEVDDTWFTDPYMDIMETIELHFDKGILKNMHDKVSNYCIKECISSDYQVIFDNGKEIDLFFD